MNSETIIKNEIDIKKWQGMNEKILWNPFDMADVMCNYELCTEQAIGSHTIQENKYLKIIEPLDNPIYRLTFAFKNGRRTPYLEENPKNKATVFSGFCPEHDSKIFKIIESSGLIQFTIEELYALVYRSVVYEYNKLYKLTQLEIELHFKTQPCVFSNRPLNGKMLEHQFYHIVQYRANIKRLENLLNLKVEIEKNYDEVGNKWDINNDILEFTAVRRIPIKEPSFVFQTMRVMRNRDNPIYHELNFQYLDTEKDNYMCTICLPDNLTNEQIVVFSTLKTADEKLKSEFFNYINTSSTVELSNVLSNLILYNNEEFYFSKKYYFELLSESERNDIMTFIEKRIVKNMDILDLGNLYLQSPINMIR
jgi:hypothetical protein